MAWIKQIADESTGAVAEYWEVIGVVYDHRSQISTLSVGGWVNKLHYNANRNPLLRREWIIPSGLAPQLAAGAVAFVSGYAKQQAEFDGWQEDQAA